ncbi:MAG: SRPBCC domain-containing protein [Myxococcota bacterium]
MTDQDARATHERTTFRLRYAVAIDIDAAAPRVWSLLTDAEAMPRWNSTVTSVEGRIAVGERVVLRVPYSERSFRLHVDEAEPPGAKRAARLVWSDGTAPIFRGTRTYTLEPRDEGTHFEMEEVFRGLMLPLIAGSLPDFAPHFEAYARDLKREAER